VSDPIPAPVRALLLALDSVSQVEVLCLLVHERRLWTAAEVCRELRIPLQHAADLLDSLARVGVVERFDGGARLDAGSSQATAVLELAEIYPRYRVRITTLIYSTPSKPIRDFADAFRLRPVEGDQEDP
jgi:hypothetical protein